MDDSISGRAIDPESVSQNPDEDPTAGRFLEHFVDVAPLIEHVRTFSDESGKGLLVQTEDESMALEIQQTIPYQFEGLRTVVAYYSWGGAVVKGEDTSDDPTEEIEPIPLPDGGDEP